MWRAEDNSQVFKFDDELTSPVKAKVGQTHDLPLLGEARVNDWKSLSEDDNVRETLTAHGCTCLIVS